MTARSRGRVARTFGAYVVAALPGAAVGDGVRIALSSGDVVGGTVASIAAAGVTIAPHASLFGVAVGDRVELAPQALCMPLGVGIVGRAIDPTGRPLDGRGPIGARWRRAPVASSGTLDRPAVSEIFWTRIRAIDGLITIGRGSRIGIFGAPAAGKTRLIEEIAAGAQCDAVVIGLVGERGREAAMWFERIDHRTTIVCATSDRCAVERVRAADVAMAQAMSLRDRGLHVVLIVDSVARYVAALREQRVALGEAVGRGGYPPSVFAELARYLERATTAVRGSITLLCTVLTDGSDEREPLGDAARSLLDGHVVLSADLARKGHFPAIDVGASASRTMAPIVSAEHARSARHLRRAIAVLAETSELRRLGLAGPDRELARAVAADAAICRFLTSPSPSPPSQTLAELHALAAELADAG